MTVSSTVRQTGPYTSDGVAVNFPFGFKVTGATGLRVERYVGGALLSVLDAADYDVVIDSDGVGVVTLGLALPANDEVLIVGNTALDQLTQITNLGGFYPKVIEAALDKVVMLIQELKISVDKSLKTGRLDSSDPEIVLGDLRQLLIDLPLEVQARISGDENQQNYTDGRFDAIAPLLAATADAEALLRTYIDSVIMNIAFPLDCGLISDPVINNRFDLGTL